MILLTAGCLHAIAAASLSIRLLEQISAAISRQAMTESPVFMPDGV
jgi:hypothetical protein